MKQQYLLHFIAFRATLLQRQCYLNSTDISELTCFDDSVCIELFVDWLHTRHLLQQFRSMQVFSRCSYSDVFRMKLCRTWHTVEQCRDEFLEAGITLMWYWQSKSQWKRRSRFFIHLKSFPLHGVHPIGTLSRWGQNPIQLAYSPTLAGWLAHVNSH